jgi:hypothetical protein
MRDNDLKHHPEIEQHPDCWQLRFPASDEQHRRIAESLEKNLSQARCTHLFGGRYENIYLDIEQVPELKPVLERVVEAAAAILDTNPEQLHYGFWFNRMEPGHSTTRHNHDDFDELLSGTCYIRVSENCGDLLLYGKHGTERIKAEEGLCVLFRPDLDHEVTINNSDRTRLSIGINFRLKTGTED